MVGLIAVTTLFYWHSVYIVYKEYLRRIQLIFTLLESAFY